MRPNQIVVVKDGFAEITGPCFVTKELYTVRVPIADFEAWQSGEYIQKAMLTTSADDREFLISGTSPRGWKKLFPNEDE